jgi:hypothetical protein
MVALPEAMQEEKLSLRTAQDGTTPSTDIVSIASTEDFAGGEESSSRSASLSESEPPPATTAVTALAGAIDVGPPNFVEDQASSSIQKPSVAGSAGAASDPGLWAARGLLLLVAAIWGTNFAVRCQQ